MIAEIKKDEFKRAKDFLSRFDYENIYCLGALERKIGGESITVFLQSGYDEIRLLDSDSACMGSDVFLQAEYDNICSVIASFGICAYIIGGEGADTDELAEFLNYSGFEQVIINEPLFSQISGKIKYKNNSFYANVLAYTNKNIVDVDKPDMATYSDARQIHEMLRQSGFAVPGFDEFYSNLFSLRKSGGGETFVIRKDGVAACSAAVLFKTKDKALIGAVVTNEKFRGMGYATKIVSSLRDIILSEGKTPVITYFKENAGRIYMKLGFTHVARLGIIEKVIDK